MKDTEGELLGVDVGSAELEGNEDGWSDMEGTLVGNKLGSVDMEGTDTRDNECM